MKKVSIYVIIGKKKEVVDVTLKDVKGIGPKSELMLNKLGISSANDLLTHYPFRYEMLERTDLRKVEVEEAKVIVDGKVDSIPVIIRIKAGLNKMNFRLVTTDGCVVGVSIFNRAFLKKQLGIGSNIIVFGKFIKNKNILMAHDIRIGSLSNSLKIEPVYHTTTGLSNKVLSNYINHALVCCTKDISDYIPDYLIKKYDFVNKKTALNIIHNPSSLEKLKQVTIRLKYEELFEFMFKINYLKQRNNLNSLGIARSIEMDKIRGFTKKLPFELTNDQKFAIDEIVKDLNHQKRMNRLLQGDVGSGKTIVAIIAMYANFLSHYQSALMAPTEILAVQHFNNIKEVLVDYNINVELLTGSTNKREKNRIYQDLEEGKIDIIVGTHALIQDDVKYYNLGLVITDEQHRFGVNQRANLKNKGIMPDVLYMSATPIPRTYALTIYGDMDITSIKEMPKGRKPVETYLKTEEEIKDVLSMMLEELKLHHQIYVIAPLIEESDSSNLSNVNELRDKMVLAFGKNYKIDLIHGKIQSGAKDLVMGEFKTGKIDILISTTVIEVGVDVPNASMIVIFDAERFGLSTLHQLRGRVGRSDVSSKCILISNSDTKRLSVMCETNDGFLISEEDFKLRGSGDLFGTRQSGDMLFKIANLKQDYKILLQAKKDSQEFLDSKELDTKKLKDMLINKINSN